MQQADTIYEPTGKTNYSYERRGDTIVFKNMGADSFKNSELTAYIKTGFYEPPNKEISGRWSIDRHYGNNIVMCYDLSFNMSTGKTRWRYEDVHPEYTNTIDGGQTDGAPLAQNKWCGLKFVRKNHDNGVLLEIYQDAGETGDWKRLFSVYNTRYIVNDYPNGAEVALKVHELTEKQDYELRDVSLVEIKPS